MFAPEQLADNSPLVAADGVGLAPQSVQEAVNGKSAKAGGAAKNKKKQSAAVNVRNWLRIDQNGETTMIQADKYKLTHKLGVQVWLSERSS
jgi:magnesium transporter